MKILQVMQGFPPEAIAGTERYCEALSRRLLGRGHECLVLAGSERGAPEATLSTVEQDGLLVTRYLMAERRPHRWTEEYDPEAEGLARHLLALVKPEVVHLHHWLHLTNNLVAICADSGIPVVVTLHDVWTSCPRIHRIRSDGEFCSEPVATAPCPSCAERSPWQGDEEIARALTLRQEMMETELALADAIIVPSEAHRALLLSLLDLSQERLVVLPHGSMPTVAPNEGRQGRLTFPNRPLQIGHWGYLVYEKGTHLILEAVLRLRDPSAVQLHLIGTTVEQEYEQRLRDLARDISVQFHGVYRPTDLQAFDLDLAVFASIASESYSFALDEALCLGLPVIVSDRGALPERVGAAGLTFRAGDAGDLARRLQEIMDAPEVLDAMRRGIRPETLFSMEAHVAMLEKIYEDAFHTKTREQNASTPHLKLIAHVQQQVREREEALARLQRQLTVAQARVQELEAGWVAEARSAELESRLAAAEAAAAALAQEHEAERAHLQTEFAALSESCQATEARNAELAAQLAAAEARSAELESRLAAAEAAAAALAQEHEADLAALTQARQLAEQRVEEMSNRLGSLENAHLMQLQEMDRVVGALEAERNRLTLRLADIEKTPAARLQALLAKLNRGKKVE